MATSVCGWIDRKDGGREANLGSWQRPLRDKKTGRGVMDPDGRPLMDEAYAQAVLDALDGYSGQNVADVLADLTQKRLSQDKTGALQDVLTMILKIGTIIVERQRRATNDTLRARHLAEIELTNLTLYIRGD